MIKKGNNNIKNSKLNNKWLKRGKNILNSQKGVN
jgi:hypothetical protein